MTDFTTARPEKTDLFRTLCWAVYLGCSWTWCIGMFLPVILVSEFGLLAWFVFTIPNVIGAAAMGWTLARPGTSERIVREHHTACVAFSAITLAFHLFFLYWLWSIRIMPTAFAIGAVTLGFTFGWIGRRRIGLDFFLAFLVLCISLAVFTRGMTHPVFGVQSPVEIDRTNISMLGLAPVCVFGFFLCPYLDLTFHRARQQTATTAGKAAFGIGFGIVFLLMLVLTLMYTGDFALDRPGYRFGSFGYPLLISWVALHIAAQAGFTFAAHLRALPKPRATDPALWAAAAILLALSVFFLRQQLWFDHPGLHIQMLTGNLIYRLFMSFYGLLFPAYVWICIVPLRAAPPGATPRSLTVTAIAVLLATPMFWLGFINEQMLWLLPAAATLLLARTFANTQNPN
jgi:hypothetical protein